MFHSRRFVKWYNDDEIQLRKAWNDMYGTHGFIWMIPLNLSMLLSFFYDYDGDLLGWKTTCLIYFLLWKKFLSRFFLYFMKILYFCIALKLEIPFQSLIFEWHVNRLTLDSSSDFLWCLTLFIIKFSI